MLTADTLAGEFQKLGLNAGDIVLVHSACSKFGPVEGGVSAVLAALRETLGVFGTLVVPTFTFTRRGGPSEMGAFTLRVQRDPASTHVPHPTHSCAILGYLAPALGATRNKSAYGPDSIFAALTNVDGKIMTIGLSWQDSMTYFHYIEQSVGVTYREIQDLGDGYMIYGRKPGVVTAVEPIGKLLDESGLVSRRQIGNANCRLVRAHDVYNFVSKRITNEPGLLYARTS